MVAQKVISQQKDTPVEIPEHEFNWSSVPLSEVKAKSSRLEASVFDIKAKAARELLTNCKWQVVNLWAKDGFISYAQYPGRFKRIYVSKEDGYPFYLPSQITDLYPRPTKWISLLTHSGLDILEAHEGELLLNRSGTIGPVTIVSKTLTGKIMSDDIIRAIPKDKKDLGYLYAFLRTNTGQILLTTNSYGAVISHIEPEHLQNLPVPNPEPLLKQNIHNLIIESFKARDKSNDLINQAEALLIAQLKLPPMEELQPKFFQQDAEMQNYQVKLSKIDNRFEGSYHVPVIEAIEKHIAKTAKEVTTIGDDRISAKIILPGRFKRIYVEEGQGVTFFGGKQIYELDPSNKKYLSSTKHGKRIDNELKLHENMILVTRSGTVGRINIVPKHWDNWIINEHVIRVVPIDQSIAGFVYSWLNTEYGMKLIERFIFGAVVDEIDTNHVGSIPIPLLKNKAIQAEINALVLKANKLRYTAYEKEQKAIKRVNEMVVHATDEKLSMAAEPRVKYKNKQE